MQFVYNGASLRTSILLQTQNWVQCIYIHMIRWNLLNAVCIQWGLSKTVYIQWNLSLIRTLLGQIKVS